MLPAQQAFEADNFRALDFLLGLIDQSQLVARNRVTQIVLEHSAFADLGAHPFLEETIGIAAFGLGAVEGGVGAGEKGLTIRRVVGIKRKADAGCDAGLRRIA